MPNKTRPSVISFPVAFGVLYCSTAFYSPCAFAEDPAPNRISLDSSTIQSLKPADSSDSSVTSANLARLLQDFQTENSTSVADSTRSLIRLGTAAVPGFISILEDQKAERSHYRALGAMAELGPKAIAALPILSDLLANASFGGLGMILGSGSDGVRVEPMEGMAGYRAGLRSGDEVLAVDAVDVRNLQIPDIVRLIRGPVGSQVILKVRHRVSEKPLTYSIPEELNIRRDAVPDLSKKALAVKVLSGIGPGAKPAIPALQRIVFEEKNADVVKPAVDALLTIDASSAAYLPKVLKILEDHEAAPSLGAVLILGRFGARSKSAIPNLILALKVPGLPSTSYEAIGEALKAIGPPRPSQVMFLRKMMREGNPLMRIESIAALARLPSPSQKILEDIAMRFSDEHDGICRTASTSILASDGADARLIRTIVKAISINKNRAHDRKL